jgi:hypothetical protein
MREPERVKVIDAAQTVEGVQMSLRTALDQYTREREIA